MLIHLVVGFIVAFASTVGFGIITNIPQRTLLPAGVTGAVAWVVYLAATAWHTGVIVPNLLAGLTIGLLGNFAAIYIKAPVNVMYIPCLVSLVPGAIIYMSMKDFTLGQEARAQQGLVKTLTIAIALAIGFVIAEALIAKLRPGLKKLAAKLPQPRQNRADPR